jgi:hypothetical protein
MKKIVFISLAIIALLAIAGPVFAATIRIDPHSSTYPNPVMLTSPATFSISDVSKTDYDPHILLVMTVASYNGLSGDVVVTWSGGSLTFHKADFTLAAFGGGNSIPPGVANSAKYTVASCADHLGVSGHDVYYAFGNFLANPISSTKQEFTITASSTALRMLVYAIGREGCATAPLNNKVPNTQPGLVVPELVPALLSLGSFSALGVYAIKRRRK